MGNIKKIAKEFDSDTIPDFIELRKYLSETNKLRHKFWSMLRSVRNQIGRYLYAHQISKEEFNKKIEELSDDEKDFYLNEWEAGNQIPLKKLKELMEIADTLWKVSGFKEEHWRKHPKRIVTCAKDRLFYGTERDPVLTCLNCSLPVPVNRNKYCSSNCSDQYRKKKYAEEVRVQRHFKKNTRYRNAEPKEKRPNVPNPRPNKGKRYLECTSYDYCLRKALNWNDFNCEDCGLMNK